MTAPVAYQYVVLRCVPQVDRGECVNVAVVLSCPARDRLEVATQVDADRLRALWPDLDVATVRSALEFVVAVCAGDDAAGSAATAPPSQRFGFLAAPRSTVVQPGPVHGGLTHDPAGELERLADRLLGTGGTAFPHRPTSSRVGARGASRAPTGEGHR